nr:MAG TPA: hypothetical protein [Caudoviricetes sp.]
MTIQTSMRLKILLILLTISSEILKLLSIFCMEMKVKKRSLTVVFAHCLM